MASVYFDVLDPERTAVRGSLADIRKANESVCRGEAELKMSLLCGATPVFPQTYGWDSSALLSYGAEDSFEGASFRWFLRKGLIRIRLRNAASIWHAALAAFESPTFRRLGAWTEFNTKEDRKPLVEAMRTGQCPFSLSPEIRNRLELLRQLSDDVKAAPPHEPELPRLDRLSRLIREASEVTKQIDLAAAELLWRCATETSDPNNRTVLHEFLVTEALKNPEIVPEVREIIDSCYNAVVAQCVRAKASLTLPLSQPVAREVLLGVLPGSVRSDLFEAALTKSADISELKTVGWHTIKLFLEECGNLSVTEAVRDAEAARLIARTSVENLARYALATKWSNVLYNAAIWGASGAAGFAVGGASGAILAVTAASALAGALGVFNVGSTVQDHLEGRLERKWLGLIQAREANP